MTDLRERFRTLDAVEVPDLRPAILERPPASVPRARPLPRLLAAAVAASFAILGIGLGIRAFLEENDAVRPVHPGSGRVESVLDIETYPGGAEASWLPNAHMIARAVVDDRVHALAVTMDEDDGVLCFHLGSGEGCGGPTGPDTGVIGFFMDVDGEPPDGPGTTFIYGSVIEPVSEVVVSFRDGTTLRTRPIEGPPGYEVDFYVVGVRGTPLPDRVVALDREGRVLHVVRPGR